MDRLQAQQLTSSLAQGSTLSTTSAETIDACSVSIPSQSNALVVTKADPENEANLNAEFGLCCTLQKIIDTSDSTSTTPEELFRSDVYQL